MCYMSYPIERFDYMVYQFMNMSTCPEVTWVNQEDLDLRMLPLYWRYPNFPRGVPDKIGLVSRSVLEINQSNLSN